MASDSISVLQSDKLFSLQATIIRVNRLVLRSFVRVRKRRERSPLRVGSLNKTFGLLPVMDFRRLPDPAAGTMAMQLGLVIGVNREKPTIHTSDKAQGRGWATEVALPLRSVADLLKFGFD